MKRRALAMLLAVMMIISLIPVTAQAACNHTPTYVPNFDNARYHRIFCATCGEEYDFGTHHYVGGECVNCHVADPNCQHKTKQTVGHTVSCADCGMYFSTTPCNFVNGVCTVCNKVWQEAVGGGSGSGTGSTPSTPSQPSRPDYGCYHNNSTYYASETQHWALCDSCSETVVGRESHAFNNSGVCVTCGYRTDDDVAEDLCAHERDAYEYIDNDTCQRKCATCGLKYETSNHFVGERAKDLENGKHELICIDCGHVFGVKEYHSFVDGKCFCGAEAEEGCGCGDTNQYYYVKSGGGHDVYCAACGEHVRLEKHVKGECGVWNGDVSLHNVYCALCEGAMDMVKHNFKGNGDGSCECGMVCGADGSPKQHSPKSDCKLDANGVHYKECKDCDAKIYPEFGAAEKYNGYDHKKACGFCGSYVYFDHAPTVYGTWKNETHHAMACAECQQDPVAEASEWHVFVNGVCACGYTCDHSKPVYADECVENADGTHTPICKYCDMQLPMDMGDVKVIDIYDAENHVRYCRACKKDVEFAHKLTKKVYSFTQHDIVCEECNLGINRVDHKFDANGKCTECDFQCRHTETMDYTKNNTTHTEKCRYCKIAVADTTEEHEFAQGTVVCKDCGFTCEHKEGTKIVKTISTATHEIRCKVCNKYQKSEDHVVTSGVCVCGQECLHAVTEYKKTATGHTLMCSTCKKQLEEKESAHSFANGECGCGYECSHEGYTPTYANYGTKHDKFCGNCKEVLAYEDHTYVKWVCACGAKK